MSALRIAQTWDGQPARPDEEVNLQLRVEGDALIIEVEAPFHGDSPPEAPRGPTWALWEHEVVELFILGPGLRYTEIELGPYGHHLVLQLEGVRQIVARELPIAFTASREGGLWRGVATVPLSLLPPGPHRVNATAIHGQGAARRYLAWAPMPGEKPDFHRLDFYLPLVLS